jgi:alkanesulfonate monooxygenase SsuD/methylene tetrahydromethanopterin reductase-like flavin-dependent oxidoreductase (luciferase family)
VGEHVTRENAIYVAKEAEREGFDSVWVFELLVWRHQPQTPYSETPDGSLLTQYQKAQESLETLSYLVANTERILLGSS